MDISKILIPAGMGLAGLLTGGFGIGPALAGLLGPGAGAGLGAGATVGTGLTGAAAGAGTAAGAEGALLAGLPTLTADASLMGGALGAGAGAAAPATEGALLTSTGALSGGALTPQMIAQAAPSAGFDVSKLAKAFMAMNKINQIAGAMRPQPTGGARNLVINNSPFMRRYF